VRACREEGERERRLPAQVLAAMHEARLFRMYIPKALDGLEIDPITSMIVVEEIARADAAAAWNLMLGATYGLWAAFLPCHCVPMSSRLTKKSFVSVCGRLVKTTCMDFPAFAPRTRRPPTWEGAARAAGHPPTPAIWGLDRLQ